MSGVTINPALVTNALGSFYATSEGYWQGAFLDDPATRNELMAGIVGPALTTPMWGGEAVTESLITSGTEAPNVMSVLTLATAVANVTGFTVFNQASAMIQSAQSPCPLAPPSGGISFFRLGSGARIVVGISAANAQALLGAAINTTVYWDYTNQVLLLTGSGALPVKVVDVNVGNSRQVSYNAGTGFATWNNAGSCAVIQI